MEKKSLDSLKALSAFAESFLDRFPQGAVVGLCGDLGAGKTTFVRNCIQIICRRMKREAPRVTSPSFVIHQFYDDLRPPVDHFDFYRLDGVSEEGLSEIGFFERVDRCRQQRGYLFVEWPERAKDPAILGLDVSLSFSISGQSQRLVSLTKPSVGA